MKSVAGGRLLNVYVKFKGDEIVQIAGVPERRPKLDFRRLRILACSSYRRLPSQSSRVISEVLVLIPLPVV